MWSGIYWGLLLVLAAGAWGQELSLNLVTHQRPLLRCERPPYKNYAFDPFTNYQEHTWIGPTYSFDRDVGPVRSRAFWSPLGDYLMTGYDLFTWVERRQAEQRIGSALFKDWTRWNHEFNNVAVASDGYGGGGYSAIVGDGLIARFTPLTLSKTDFNGARLDVSLPQLKFTALGSRIAQPNNQIRQEGGVYDDFSTMLIGGRAQADLGPFQLGVNGVNLHAYDSTQLNNSIKGQLRQDQPLYRWLIVRITDDEPTDGRAGAVVQEVQLVINGRARPDLQAQVIRHRADVASQVGRILTLTGQFLPTAYNAIATFANRYYQEEEIPLYADYLYRLAHEADEDVSKATNLEGLLEVFALESPAMVRRVDGDEQLVYLFDLSKERYVQRVEVEAVLGKDYRVEWAAVYLNHVNATAAKIEDRFRSTFYRTAPRARGRVEDGSNLQRVRFKVGESTAIFTYSADLHLALPGIIVSGEYARSAVYGRYPANMEGELPTMGPRFAHRGAAYFANVIHWFGRGRVGAEYFSMNPDFTTEMETFLPRDSNHGYPYGSPHAGLSNETVIWRLVQDNEDGDRWPDYFLGPVLGRPRLKRLPELPLGTGTLDGDGIFPGQDENNDGIPDTNRNNNRIPDYEEDFLLYEVEPNEYVYGPDRNNNDEPDPREDDWDVDYPYDPDQRGIHLFGQVDLNRSWSAGGGRYAIKGLASGGRNRSTYVLLGYRSVGVARLRRLFFENHLRHVQDDIPDAFRFVGGSGVLGRRSGWDPLFYQDSYVNETYLEGHLRPWPSLNLVQKLRLRLNWQQGGRLYNGRFQRPRRLDFWTVVSRVDYTWRRGKLSVTPQFKYLFSRLQDQRVGRALVSEYRIVPILKVVYPLMSRTTLQAGLQGWGPLPYRVENRAQPHQSFEQRTTIVSVMNRSRYLGYDLHTIVGFQQREKEFDGPRAPRLPTWYTEGGSTVIVAPREWQFFVRGLVGFTEFGRPI